MPEPTPERRRELLRELQDEAIDAGTYGEPAPERAPLDDTAKCTCSVLDGCPEVSCPKHGQCARLGHVGHCDGCPDDTTEGTETSREGVDWHRGPHPAFGFMTTHVGPREKCTGPDCELEPDDTTEGERQ